ncbi:MAG TPA: hypothetical protein VFH61_17115 [Thermoleophilia bacterium]|nr:hypothetical protein [Thermoleophilia bacterium]
MELGSRSAVAVTDGSGVYRFGFWVSILVAVVTAATFALALTALPNKVPYPFTGPEIAAQWPGDYLWLYPAMLLMLIFVAQVATIHSCAPPSKRVFSLLGLCAAVVAAAILLIDYYLQASVMQVSLEKGQLDGWAMLTMYNPNGVFIALEELGYLLMSVVFLCLAPVFARKTGIERALRWLLSASFAMTVLALVVVAAVKGSDRGDTFEIAVISIVWLTLIAAGILTAFVFRRAGKE